LSIRSILPLFFLLACAGQVPPDGGPVDTEPPVIISTYPARNTVHFLDNRIAIEFDEYVERRSVEESIFISPYVGQLEFDWSRREIEVRFSEQLRENTTYVVNIGTDVVDIRNRNRMAQAFTLAFSTGDVIDRGAIDGRIIPRTSADAPEGVMVFAYALDGIDADTLDPRKLKPDYITQSGKNGNFALRHLRFGTYRIIAVRDEFRNLLYDPESDDYGVFASDITLSESDTLRSDILLQLAREDTTAPRLLQATAHSNRRIMAEFSERIDTASISPAHVVIEDTLGQQPLEVLAVSALLPGFSKILLLTGEQRGGAGYKLTVTDVRDGVGLRMDGRANSVTFTGSGAQDTVQLTLASTSIKDSTHRVDIVPTLIWEFTDILEKTSLPTAISIMDSAKNPGEFQLRWITGTTVELSFGTLKSKTWYTILLAVDSLKNALGERGADSTVVVRFETVDREVYSAIGGVVLDSRDDARGAIYITAVNVTLKPPRSYRERIEKPGPFSFSPVHEGQYLLSAFRDRNGNGVYDGGSVFPFHPSERFAVYGDTLKVRARWPLEGVMIELKE
jgi:hypothetical protein